MKRYLTFGGSNYYPCGGMGDFIESFDNLEDAKQSVLNIFDWCQILDNQTGTVWNDDEIKLL